MIDVQPISDDEFRVTVEEKGSTSNHTVILDDPYHERLTGNRMSKEDLIRKSFGFLLNREPKESILRRFHLKEISRYFPEYEDEIRV